MEKILTKKMLADQLAEEQGITKKAAAETVNYIFDQIAATLAEGGKADINGFGKFEVKERKERAGINPRTKEPMTIAASKAPVFKASKTLKDGIK